MSISETLAEKIKSLPESQAQAVLKYIEEISEAHVLSASELMRLPRRERQRILAGQAREAEAIYRNNAGTIIEDAEGPLGHG